MFSNVSAIKTETRNQLDVPTVSSPIKIKSYHLNDEQLFEPSEEH